MVLYSSGLSIPLVLLACFAFWTIRTKIRGRRYRLPPTVPGHVIYGNMLQVPHPAGMWLKGLAEQYGEMFTLKLGSKTWIYLNSSQAVYDLLEKRSAIYSSRPRFPMASEIMSGNSRMLIMPYGERWRRARRVMHQVLNTQQADKFKTYQDLESRRLLRDYLRSPDKWFRANQQFANSVILSIVFGRSSSLDDPELGNLLKHAEVITRNMKPGANMVDSFEWLANLPTFLQWWRPRGLRVFEQSKACYQRELDILREKIANGTAKPCFAVDWMSSKENAEVDDTESVFMFGTLMEAGSDTSRNAIGQAIAAAAIYPEWVKKARAELDSVCGANAERLPTFEDRPSLPYITAAGKETLRWRPFIQAGVPRELIKDDEYKGYTFPAGTVFTWNPWAIALSEKEYENPFEFIPDRFLNDELKDPLKGHWSFGAGRRVCAGWNVGDLNVWIVLARLLYCFNFEQIPGHEIDTINSPWMNVDNAPFSVKISPRSAKHAALIENSYQT